MLGDKRGTGSRSRAQFPLSVQPGSQFKEAQRRSLVYKMAASCYSYTVLFLALVAQAYSQCATPAPGADSTLYVRDVSTGTLGTLIFEGLIQAGSVFLDEADDAFEIMTVSSVRNPSPTRNTTTLTFTANANFSSYLDLNPNSGQAKTSGLRFMCDGNTFDTQASFVVSFTDTNNRAPVITIEDPNIHINLETWQSNEPLNFRYPIEVIDRDFNRSNGMVSLKSTSEDYLIDILETSSSSGRPFTYEYKLFLHPDVEAGNYTVPLFASDGLNNGTLNIQLYIAGGIQAQATAFTVFALLGLSVWFTFK